MLVVPTMGAVMKGLDSDHASATWAMLTSCAFAIEPTLRAVRRFNQRWFSDQRELPTY